MLERFRICFLPLIPSKKSISCCDHALGPSLMFIFGPRMTFDGFGHINPILSMQHVSFLQPFFSNYKSLVMCHSSELHKTHLLAHRQWTFIIHNSLRSSPKPYGIFFVYSTFADARTRCLNLRWYKVASNKK